jgi:hypothetical protein
MTFLTEDPTYVAGGLGLIALACFVAVQLTQQGKYLIWGLSALGVMSAVLLFEWYWVTDVERIEAVVYSLRDEVLANDSQGVLSHLTDDVEYVQNGSSLNASLTRQLIDSNLQNAHFDFIQISNLQISAGQQTRRGQAQFRLFAKGSIQMSVGSINVGTANSIWSLGFQETKPGVWMVNRITPVLIPEGLVGLPSMRNQQDGSNDSGEDRAPVPGKIGNPSTKRRGGIPNLHRTPAPPSTRPPEPR